MKPNLFLTLSVSTFGLMSGARGQAIDAANIEWKESNAFNTLRLASNLENATGMDAGQTILYNLDGTPSGEPNNANNISWLTSSKVNSPATLATDIAAGKVWIVADLGASYDLTSVKIWNFNWDNTPGSPASSLNNRGVNQFDILVRNAAADTNDGTAGGTPINVPSVSDDTGAITLSAPFNLGTTSPWTVALENQTLSQAPNNDTYTGQNFIIPAGNTARFIAVRADSFYGGTGVGLGKIRFIVDNSAPTLGLRSPADNATGFAANANLVATFSKLIQAGTGNITIRRSSDNSIVESFNAASSAQLTISGAQLTINPTNNLLVGTEYYVQIDAGAVQDLTASPYAGIVDPDTTSWSFTTDGTGPILTNRVPLDDAFEVATVSNLVAVFDEPILTGTGNITLRKTVGDSVVESFNVASSGQLTIAGTQLTINPSADLEIGTEYYVQIDAGAIQDVSGNRYPGIVTPDTTSWSFTTDDTAPTLTGLSPSAPTMALVGTRLLVQFDEPVQVGTGSVTVRKASDNSVVETIDVTMPGAAASIGDVIAIARSVVLDPNTAYYVNVPAGAFEDLSGNPAVAISGTSAWTFTTSSAVPVLLERFNGSDSLLSGTSADVFAAAITTAGGSAVWTAGAGFLGNGAVGATSNSQAFLNLGSYINSTKGTPAGKFELTVTISENDPSWISVGFAGSSNPGTVGNFTTTGTGVATIIYRGQTGTVAAPNVNGEIDMFAGLGNATGVDEGAIPYTGFRTLTIALDLTAHNGTSNFGTVTWSDSVAGLLGSHSFTANRNFNSILITHATSNGTIDGLALYQTGTPGATFASWIGTFSVGGLVGADDDFDQDGLANAVENLLGTSPEVFSPGLTNIARNGANLVFRHTRSTTPATDLTGSYQWSTDLVNWQASGVPAAGTTVTFATPVVIIPGTPQLVEVTATVTGTAAPKVFARFRATQN
jgi:hypothetical protein